MTSKRRKPNTPSDRHVKRADPVEKSIRKTKSPGVRSPAQSTNSPNTNKQARCLDLLARRDGAVLSELVAATEWQPHSVRGFLSGVVKKKLGLALHVSTDEDGTRRYRIARDGRSRR
jgi:hypothetical protein